MRQYYLYKRKETYYAKIQNKLTGELMLGKSTGSKDRDEAAFVAMDWIKNGIPEGSTEYKRSIEKVFSVDEFILKLKTIDPTIEEIAQIVDLMKKRGFISAATIETGDQISLISFLTDFWDFEKSQYVQEKISHGHSLTRRYIAEMQRLVERFHEPYFSDKELISLNRQDYKDFSIHLSKQKKIKQSGEESNQPLSVNTINRILKAGSIPLKWAFENGFLESNPTAGLMKFAGKSKRRGILTDKEIKKLFSKGDWKDNQGAKLANLLAMQTGLRAGEIVALRIEDIKEDRIFVQHSWNITEGLKTTKTGESRQVPILPDIRKDLLVWAKQNPFGCKPQSFVFFQAENEDKPIRPETLLLRLNTALESIGIKHEEKLSRGLTFHSWRHSYAKYMADVLDERAMKLTGHKTSAVFESYADHANEEDFKKASTATSEVFGRVLDFKQAQ